MHEYEITRDGLTFTVQLDDETARAWGLLERKAGDHAGGEEHAVAPKAESRTRKGK